ARAAHAGRGRYRHTGAGGVGGQAALGGLAPPAGRAGHGGARRGVPGGRRGALRTRRVAAVVPVQPGGHHLWRVRRDTAQHHRRAGARPTPGGTRPMTAIPSAPAYPTGHALLAGKVVVVTAAAGTGIGTATARRCLEEGASVVISDWHERRLGETRDALAAEHGDRLSAAICDVTQESQVRELIAAAVGRFGRLDVMVNNAGLGGTRSVLEMTDDEWSRVLDVTL